MGRMKDLAIDEANRTKQIPPQDYEQSYGKKVYDGLQEQLDDEKSNTKPDAKRIETLFKRLQEIKKQFNL